MHSLDSAKHTFMVHKKVEDIYRDNSVAKFQKLFESIVFWLGLA